MNIFKEIELLFKVNQVVQEAQKMDTTTSTPTPSWKTGEFWSQVLLVDIPAIIGAASGVIPAPIAGYILLGSRVSYTLARLWFKRDVFVTAVKGELTKLKSGDISDVNAAVDKVTTTNVTVNP